MKRKLYQNAPHIASSSSTQFIRFWFFTVDDDVKYSFTNEEHDIAQYIDGVLNEARGWKKKGYQFVQVAPDEGMDLRKTFKGKKNIIHLRMSSSQTIQKTCNFANMNCADRKVNVIFINSQRWLHGSKESNMDIWNYRRYIINHEIGHLLNRGHHDCLKGKKSACPIMKQQTVDTSCCIPNSFPLEWE
jgi:hypothetical protein